MDKKGKGKIKAIVMNKKKASGYVIEINFIGENMKNYRPDALYNITGIADLSEMIKDNHIKIRINREDFWIPFKKNIK